MHDIASMYCAVSIPIPCAASSQITRHWGYIFTWCVWFGNLIWHLLVCYLTIPRSTSEGYPILIITISWILTHFINYSYPNVKYIWIFIKIGPFFLTIQDFWYVLNQFCILFLCISIEVFICGRLLIDLDYQYQKSWMIQKKRHPYNMIYILNLCGCNQYFIHMYHILRLDLYVLLFL